MDPATSGGPPTAWSGLSLAKTVPADIGDLILAEHARILRLFGALDDAARRGEPAVARSAVSQIWVRLADLIELDASAEEEICFPLLFGRDTQALALIDAAIADHYDICEVVEEARLLDVGSARWWRTVRAARATCIRHFATEEQGLLAEVCRLLPLGAGKMTARQWNAFMAAWADGTS